MKNYTSSRPPFIEGAGKHIPDPPMNKLFLYCYECVYPTYTARVKENNGVWECDECATTNDINKEIGR